MNPRRTYGADRQARANVSGRGQLDALGGFIGTGVMRSDGARS
jgi:hypothetical protein